SPWTLAVAARLTGSLAAARGDFEAADDALRAALAAQKRYRWPFEYGRTLLALGDAQRRAKQKRAARDSLAAAAAAFEELGAPLWAARAHASLARTSGRTTGGRDLTQTERRVAE